MKRMPISCPLARTSLNAGSAQQAALAPWFDADAFYTRSGVDVARASNDLAACRIEAARLKSVRSANTRVASGAAFNSSGQYDPVVSGASVGIASIMFAIQDANYNGSIEQIEFRDCAVALGYRHYRLGDGERERFNALADHGFAALVSAPAPAGGRYNESESERNYFSAEITTTLYQNGPARAPQTAPAMSTGPVALTPLESAVSPYTDAAAPAPESVAAPPTGPINRLAPGAIATPRPGMAIVVASA